MHNFQLSILTEFKQLLHRPFVAFADGQLSLYRAHRKSPSLHRENAYFFHLCIKNMKKEALRPPLVLFIDIVEPAASGIALLHDVPTEKSRQSLQTAQHI